MGNAVSIKYLKIEKQGKLFHFSW